MKNPFQKEDHTAIIAAVAIASVTLGAIAFLFLTEKGKDARKGLKKRIKSLAKNAAADAVSKRTKVPKKVAKVVADQVVK